LRGSFCSGAALQHTAKQAGFCFAKPQLASLAMTGKKLSALLQIRFGTKGRNNCPLRLPTAAFRWQQEELQKNSRNNKRLFPFVFLCCPVFMIHEIGYSIK